MKRILLIIFCISISWTGYGQKNKEHYVSVKFLREVLKRKITKKDLEKIKVKGTDTLILVKDFSKIIDHFSKNKNSKNKIKKVQHSRTYISLKSYRRKYNQDYIPKNIDDFIIKDGDTLIRVDNKAFHKNGVSVPYEIKDSVFLENYKDIVYQKYHFKKPKKEIRLRYWKKEIKIYFTKNIDKKVRNEVKKFAKFLAKNIDSLNISFVNKLEKSNYLIYGINSDNDYNYEPRIKNNKVSYYAFWNNKQQLYSAKLQVDSRVYKNKKDLILKTKKMFLNSLGMFNWSYRLPKEGYFSLKYYKNKEFTDLDLEILKYHYSYGICKGMTLKLFEQAHKNAKDYYKKTGKQILFKHID
jgi:hypothetical protein